MKRRGGCLWIIVGLLVAGGAGALTFTTILRATAAQPPTQTELRGEVVTVVRDVPRRAQVQAEDVALKEIPLSAIPPNAVRTLDEVVGKVATSPLIAGEILLAPRVAEPGAQRLDIAVGLGLQTMPIVQSGQVIMAFPAEDLMSQAGLLQAGDQVDLLFSVGIMREAGDDQSNNGKGELVTFAGLQNIRVTAVVVSSPTSISDGISSTSRRPAILLALAPQDALVIKHLKDMGGMVDVVLRAPEDDTEFDLAPVDDRYLKDRYQLAPRPLP